MIEEIEMTTQYVPWGEGADILGVGRSSFFDEVRRGNIGVEPGRGLRDNRYSVEDIRKVAAKRRIGHRRRIHRVHPEPVILDWLSATDIPAILRLDQVVYDQMFIAEAQVYQSWSEKNPQLAMAAFNPKSDRQEMWAYLACLPLDEEVILSVLRREREEKDITVDEMQTYEREGAYTLLANSAVVHPEHPRLLLHVLRGMIEAWVERFPERYISRIYTQSVSERGDLLVSNYFMQPRYDLAENAYMLDMARPARNKVLRGFQEALKAKDPEKYHELYETASFFS